MAVFSVLENNADTSLPVKNLLITLVTLAVFWVLNAYPWSLFGRLASDTEGWPRVAALVQTPSRWSQFWEKVEQYGMVSYA